MSMNKSKHIVKNRADDVASAISKLIDDKLREQRNADYGYDVSYAQDVLADALLRLLEDA
jgi:hypothetical protein